jgi:cyclophilin family peptidyl-prolyl cis-trans isomerase
MTMSRRIASVWLMLIALVPLRAGTLAIFQSSVGTMQLDLYDGEKPATVANFIRYVRSGRFTNMFVQRWEPGFVIQGGGYYIEKTETNSTVRTVPTFPNVTNEYSVGKQYSNAYGTIAMARRGGETNSASSQWFLNLTNNAFLDSVDGGFTVFGRVISGTNVLNKFIPPHPSTNNISRIGLYGTNQYDEAIFMDTLPVLDPNPTLDDLVYVNVSFIQCKLDFSANGDRVVSWNCLSGQTNTVEYSTSMPPQWKPLLVAVGTRGTMFATNSAPPEASELYRVRLDLAVP